MVDRPQPGAGRDYTRQAQLASEVTNQVTECQRHQQSAHPFADEVVGPRGGAAGGPHQPRGLDPLAGQLGGEVGGHGRAITVRRDRVVRLGRASRAA